MSPGRTAFGAGTVFENAFAVVVVEEDGVGFAADETVDANDVGDNDWQIWSDITTEGTDDYIALGFAQQFSRLTFDNLNGVQGVGSGLATVWEYWTGSVWASLAGVTDGTSEFTTAVADGQTLTFTIPSDWARTSLDGSAQLYFVRLRITAGTYTTNPVYDQGFVGGIGEGAFQAHTRHGAGAQEGESAWVGVSSIGTIEANTHLYIAQEDPDGAAGGFADVLVTAAKGASDWWADGQIDLLIKVKEADSVFGALPNSSPVTAVATVLARQFSTLYSHFIANALATAGGNTVVPLATGDDLNNTTGYRQMILADSAGNWNVGDRIRDDSDTTIEGIITQVTGTNPTITLQYYLYGDPLNDFTAGTGDFSNLDDTGTAAAVAPSDVGPAADTSITLTSGATTEDINNGNGARPYSVRLDPNSVDILRTYERMKFLTRRGETVDIDSSGSHVAEGQFYVGNEIQIEYSNQAGGNFAEGSKVFDQTSGAEGVVVADHDDGASGDVILRIVRGTFQTGAANLGDTATSPTVTADIDTIRVVAPVSAAPLGTFAGGSFFGAPGVALTIANLISADTQAYQLIDDDGNIQVPPNTVAVEVTNLVVGDRVGVYRIAAAGGAVVKNEFSGAAGNDENDVTLEIQESLTTETPTSGKVRIVSPSGEEHRYRYSSQSGTTFTLATATTGVGDGASSATRLEDGSETFIADGVEVGDYVQNITEGVFVRVTNVVSETELDTEPVVSWLGDTYFINRLVENYPVGQDVYVPFLEREADATVELNQLVHTSDIDVRVVVRNAGVILPFSQDTIIISTGRSVAAIRATDDIFV